MSLPRTLGPLVLLLSLVAFALSAAEADAAAKKKPKAPRCAAGTTPIGKLSAPSACLPKAGAAPDEVLLALAPKFPRGAKRSVKAERRAAELVRQILALKTAGGRIVPRGVMVRRAAGDPLASLNLGSTETYTSNGTRESGTFREGALEYRIEGTESGALAEVRDRNGRGATLGMVEDADTPRCPTADGQVPAKRTYTFTFGRSASLHGKRYWFLVTMKVEGPWKGHVGVGAKTETYDIDLRASVELRSGVEIAATGKVLKREPTRTYRAALTRSGIPIATPFEAIAQDVRLRGPNGTRVESVKELEAFGAVAYAIGTGLGEITGLLEKGDKRWYDERACATLDYNRSPEHVVTGGAADWDAWVRAADGAPVSASRWAPRTDNGTCGTLSWSASGPDRAHFHVADTARAWNWDPDVPACVQSDVTTPAGRPRLLETALFVEPPAKWKYTIKVTYAEDMGQGIAPTRMTGTGTVTLAPREPQAEGSGSYSGTEWDGGVGNPCGEDMGRQRGFSGTATTGATNNDDGSVTVAFVADERPLRMSWIVVLDGPGQGKTEHITATQPFCGEAKRSATTADVVVTAAKAAD